MFQVFASKTASNQPLFINVRSEEFATREEAEELHANFPKSVNAKVNRCVGNEATTYAVILQVNLQPSKGNDRNEGGIRRYLAFRKTADKLGTVTFAQGTQGLPTSWAYFTEAELEDAIKPVQYDMRKAWQFIVDSYDGMNYSPTRGEWSDAGILEFIDEYHVTGRNAFKAGE